jgi:two-component system sensor histidine kinase BaeS
LVTVTDCGPGIPPEHLKDVFTRFAHLKIDDPRAAYGAGLGLSVVKAIVEAQGGQISADNYPGGGAAFSFSVPLA